MTDRHSPAVRLAGRLSRHALLYALAATSGLLAGLLGVAVFTRYLDPSEFGRLAVLSTLASIVTLLANIGILQGTMRRIYGSSGDEDAGDLDDPAETTKDVRLSLATGFALTVALGGSILLVAWLWQDRLADWLVGEEREGDLVVLAVFAGAVAAAMRLGRNFVRLQRRPGAYLAITLVSTLGGTLVAIPLLAGGLGIEGVLIGFAAGSTAGVMVTIVLLRSDIRLAVSAREGVAIVRAGLYYVPLVLSFQTIQLADVLLVAQLASFRETGLYRVAQRIAMPVTYGTSVFIQSWGPLRRDLVHVAADMEQGEQLMSARLVTYYLVFVSGLVVSVAVLADQLVGIAAAGYADAAMLVPLTTIGIAGHGGFVLSYRVSTFPGKRSWFVRLAVLAAALFVGCAALSIPVWGAVGAPISAIVAWSAASIAMISFGQAGDKPIPFERWKLSKLALLTAAVGGIGYWLLPGSVLGVIGKGGLLAAWGAALIALGVLPRGELGSLTRFARSAQGESNRSLRHRVEQLDSGDRALLDQLARQGLSPTEVAEAQGLTREEILARAVRALRLALDGGPQTAFDAAVGELLFVRRPRAERDVGLRALVDEGLDPIDADRLVRASTAVAARRLRRR